MIRIIASVTQEDIDRGRPSNSLFCPMALALGRAGLHYAEIAQDAWYPYGWHIDTRRIKCSMTIKAVTFVDRFDRGKPVRPGRYAFYYDE